MLKQPGEDDATNLYLWVLKQVNNLLILGHMNNV